MLDHGLEIVAYSLKLRQSHLLPIGANPEDQAAQAEAWTAAVAYAALLHDIGKVAVDLHVELADGKHLASLARPTAPAVPLPLP
jgi:HD superfamily phosphodiesterase